MIPTCICTCTFIAYVSISHVLNLYDVISYDVQVFSGAEQALGTTAFPRIPVGGTRRKNLS